MGRKQRECYLCGAAYNYCPTCSQDRMKPAWMAEFHNENCKNIFDICTKYNMQMMSKTEAQEALNVCDLSNKANFKQYVQRDLENIYKEEPTVKRGKRVEINPVDEAAHEVVTKENE